MRLTDADALKQTFCAECDHSIKCEDCDIDYHFEHLAPTIGPVKHGEWIYGEHDIAMCDGYWCDQCGFFVPWDYEHKFIDFIKDYHWCPNCGCKMEEV